jgi:hypothetical protein
MKRLLLSILGVAGLILSVNAGTALAAPTADRAGAALASPSASADAKVTICHATRSVTHPYVAIKVSESDLAAHKRHQDRRDIVPAPGRGCPPDQGPPAPGSGPFTPCVVGPGVVQTANTVTGTNADDTIDCTSASPGKWIIGLAGNDTITGTAVHDTVIAGAGNDTVTGGPGIDYLEGNAGNDTLTGSGGPDTLLAGFANDTLSGGVGNDTLIALPSDSSEDSVNGDADADTCTGHIAEGDTLTACEM